MADTPPSPRDPTFMIEAEFWPFNRKDDAWIMGVRPDPSPRRFLVARIPLVDPDDPSLDASTRAALAKAGSARPDAPIRNVYRAMANHPQALEAFLDLAGVTYRENSLPDPKLRELPYLTSAVANNCFY